MSQSSAQPSVAGVTLACPCGEVYELKPEYAGRLLECPVCKRHLRAGPAPTAARRFAIGVDPAFDRDVFLLRERVLTIRSKYEVWTPQGTAVLYVERPTFPIRTLLAFVLGLMAAIVFGGFVARAVPALRVLGAVAGGAAFVVVSMSVRPLRHVTVYRDDSRREVLLRVLQDQRVAVLRRTYTVLLPSGEVLARLAKHYVHNVVRKRWYVETTTGRRVAMAMEDSMVLSLLRRVLGPLFGLLRTNFLLVSLEGTVLGEFNRKFTLFDRYVLDLTADRERLLDRRVALALGVMLDTGERR